MSKSRFIILCPPRSGSTMLRKMLDSHDDICCHGELLGRNRVLGISGKNTPGMEKALEKDLDSVCSEWLLARDRNPNDFLSHTLKPNLCDAVGCKILYNQLADINLYCVNSYFEKNKDIKIIFLDRRNRLKWYVSYLKHKTKHKVNNKKKLFFINTVEKINIDPFVFLQHVNSLNLLADDIINRFSGHKSIQVFYEDIISNKDDSISRILEFIDIPPCTLEFVTEKGGSDNLKDVIDNYKELQAFPEIAQYL